MDDLKVAAVCMKAEPGQVTRNLNRIQSLTLEAAREGAEIVCFPELSISGYTLKSPPGSQKDMDSVRAVDRLVRMAKDARLVLIAGLVEDSVESGPFITQVIAGPEGLIGIYRKTHLSPHEKDIYTAGEEIKTYPYRNTLFGVQLCYEAHFPEISTVMALMGAEVIFIPHASPRGGAEGKLQSWLRHLTARAFDNGVFVVACNQVGKTHEGFYFPGVAVILGPDGQELARCAGEEEMILFAALEADMLKEVREHRMKYFIPRRRPNLYQKIVQ